MKLHKADHVRGEITVPGDKSISHRSVMFGSIAKGTTEIHNFLESADCLSTIGCFRRMGIDIENKNGVVTVQGKGMHGLAAPAEDPGLRQLRNHHKTHLRYSRAAEFRRDADR